MERLVFIVATAAFTSLGTASPRYVMQQAMYLPCFQSHFTNIEACLASRHRELRPQAQSNSTLLLQQECEAKAKQKVHNKYEYVISLGLVPVVKRREKAITHKQNLRALGMIVWHRRNRVNTLARKDPEPSQMSKTQH